MAYELGYEPSYLSALERGEKGPPRGNFVGRLTHLLLLTPDEVSQLENAIRASQRQISIPRGASNAEFLLAHQLAMRLGHLHPAQIKLIQLALAVVPEAIEEAGLLSKTEEHAM